MEEVQAGHSQESAEELSPKRHFVVAEEEGVAEEQRDVVRDGSHAHGRNHRAEGNQVDEGNFLQTKT